jgi:hypothetical protein
MMTLPRVLLDGEWPPVSEGLAYIPTALCQSWPGSLEAFGYYLYLVSLGYGQDDLNPLPQHVGPAKGMRLREAQSAFTELVSIGLIRLVPGEGDEIAEVHVRGEVPHT